MFRLKFLRILLKFSTVYNDLQLFTTVYTCILNSTNNKLCTSKSSFSKQFFNKILRKNTILKTFATNSCPFEHIPTNIFHENPIKIAVNQLSLTFIFILRFSEILHKKYTHFFQTKPYEMCLFAK